MGEVLRWEFVQASIEVAPIFLAGLLKRTDADTEIRICIDNAINCTLAELLDRSPDLDQDAIDWARLAAVGETFHGGGGADAAYTLTRIP